MISCQARCGGVRATPGQGRLLEQIAKIFEMRISRRDLRAGADVLVHSVVYPPAIDRLVARVPNAAVLKASILAHQTSAEDAGRVAQHAGVKTLVLSHFVPPDDVGITEGMWRDAASRHFRGTVIVGRDLLEI